MSDSSSIIGATKWSLITQVVSRLISPITTLVLAHILTPASFGVVATVTMVVSFASMFADSGFQKYLIQHNFRDAKQLDAAACVAFWTNLLVSIALWAGLALFNEQIAFLVGNDGLGVVLVVAGANIPLASFISVQTGLLQRAYRYRSLFWSRLISSLLILIVAVPCAFFGFDYWSMIVSTIVSNVFVAAWLTLQSDWKPRFFYKVSLLRQMLSFSVWTLAEAIAIWFTAWAGTFVVGHTLSPDYLGMYKTSTSVVQSINGIATGAIAPILFAALSRLQDDRPAFIETIEKSQRFLSIVVLPICFCVFCFRDFFVLILLGEAWTETSLFLGLYSLANGICFLVGGVGSEAYRALGKPKFSLAIQLVFLAFLIPCVYWSSLLGYEVFSCAAPLINIVYVLVHLFALHRFVGYSAKRVFSCCADALVISVIVTCVSTALLTFVDSVLMTGLLLVAAVLFYAALSYFVKPLRQSYMQLFSLMKRRG